MRRRTATVVVATHNRCEDLRHTLEQLRSLDPRPDEILIFLDGCTDGSREMLDAAFPECTVVENAIRAGSIPCRDRAFRQVTNDLIVSLDDDSYPVDTDFIARISDLVDRHPEAGAFTFPEIRNDGMSPDANFSAASPGHYIAAYPDCAGVMIRSLYGTVAAYLPFFSHTYEEPDYCVQLYAAGYAVWFEPSLKIRHHFAPRERNMLARHLLNARNEFWSVLIRCPFPYVIPVALFRVARQFGFACGMGWKWWSREPKWWWSALVGIPRCFAERKPIPWKIYFAWMRLARNPAVTTRERAAALMAGNRST